MSIFPHNGADGASLLANAGAALFRAKQKSRGTISLYQPEMDQQIRDRRVLHQELSVAIKNGELSLYFQPQAASGRTVDASEIIGFEALARWHHPVRGFVPPGDFIPLAEEGGLIVGAFQDSVYTQGQIDLQPGDRLVMFTDGLTELTLPSGQLLGEEALGHHILSLLKGEGAGSSAQAGRR